ncbi:hemolysin family protein [Terrabacter sp. GCM10028922]|uniref:hemolysin family protein n=1 Tax=Terrabacter sp. GCM10028922 TaxID=3273428 RepID=UPI00360A8037
MITALLVSVLLLVLNAFFVAAEFAIVASKRHRLEDLAERGSLAARAAVRASRELSLMLAGAQLGITLCTLGLGSLAKPAVAELLTPVFTFARVPDAAAYVVSLVLAVGIVVFLHMVVGEMAPKSWAIAHPERSAVLLALPFRAFARVARPALWMLNAMANGCLRLLGVTPQDELGQVHGPKELQLLIASSRAHGMLAEPEHRVLAGAIDLDTTPLTDVLVPIDRAIGVPTTATCAEAEALSRDSGRSRLVVSEGDEPVGIAHVRDIVRAAPGTPVAAVTAPAVHVATTLSLLDTVSLMRARHAQLVLVDGPSGPVGFVTMEDLLERVLGRFDDETDA